MPYSAHCKALPNTMKTRLGKYAKTVVFASTGILLLMASAFAESPQVNWGDLHLTSQQTQQINQVEDQWKSTASEVLPQIQQDRSELVRLLNTPGSDQQRIITLQNRMNINKAKLHNAAMQSFLKKKQYLDPQQQQQLHQLLDAKAL